MARQKITESMDYDDELPLLTEQDMAYVLARIEGKGQADAYRISHPDTTATPKSVWELASRVERRPQVQVWLGHPSRSHPSGVHNGDSPGRAISTEG